MTEPYKFPARSWGDEPVAAAVGPTVLVSSRDGAAVPHVAAAVRLEAAAKALGWTVRQTYALANVPPTPRKSGHVVATVAVRMRRGRGAAFAMWRNEDDKGWRFDHALVNGQPVGARSIVAALT